MPARDLEVEIMRGRRREAGPFDLFADPNDTTALQIYLKDWLAAARWSPGLWGKFTLDVRNAGEWRLLKRVRA